MHDIRALRADPETYDAGWARRGLEAQTPAIIALDEALRAAKSKRMDAEAIRNSASKAIGAAKARKDEGEAERLMAQVAEAKAAMEAAAAEEAKVEPQLHALLSALPNLPDAVVPDGTDETGNEETKRWGSPRKFNYAPKDHVALGEGLGLMDFERAARMSGTRFVVLKGPLARLERALGQFMLDFQTEKRGYSETNPPLLVRDEAMYGTGQLPKFENDLFAANSLDLAGLSDRALEHGLFKLQEVAGLSADDETTEALNYFVEELKEDRHFLIPTAEVSLTNLHMGEILDEEALPVRLTALTPCFRAEAGSAGRDTRGMIRQHQFWKTELVCLATPEQSEAEHIHMVESAEAVLEALELPYRRMLLCAGDMGFSAKKTFDLEVWLPGQDTFREISSVSNCGDFQARRMNTRCRAKGEKQTRFLHTLNGSGLAVGRTLIAVIENWQNEDGSITIPPVLRPYMGGMEMIGG